VGRQRRPAFTVLSRHRHPAPYVAVVLSGAYEEAGDRGLLHATAGSAVLHGGFEGHLNRYAWRGAEVLNLPLPIYARHDPDTPLMTLKDPDLIVRLAERDPQGAVDLLVATLCRAKTPAPDWPAELAIDLGADPHLALSAWADDRRLAPATISRGFKQLFGITPSAFRAEVRSRKAWLRTVGGRDTLSAIAAATGFADQAHMTRSVRAVTGRTPGVWRRAVKYAVKYDVK
jgi:AraC-like DNA-binding protein